MVYKRHGNCISLQLTNTCDENKYVILISLGNDIRLLKW